jgi:zinc protease
MDSLFIKMPEKPERMDGIHKALLQSIFTAQPDFRDLPERVAYWKNQGYNTDPREYQYSVYKTLTFDDIVKFYRQQIAGKPLFITIAGNMKAINKNDLKKFGTVIEVKQAQIIKE